MQPSGDLLTVFTVSAAWVVLAALTNLFLRLRESDQEPDASKWVEVTWSLVPVLALVWMAGSVLMAGNG